jgi:AmmeMemoRadiSam system protein A
MPGMISQHDRARILKVARLAIAEALAGGAVTPPPDDGAFGRHAGVFVSLHAHGDLRGCIGHPDGDERLADVVGRCAVAAAREDPRFPSVTLAELPDIDIEVSVLGNIEPVERLDDIEIGRHGLIAERGRRRGLLLPQVATEHRWNRDTFVRQTCVKAGLPPDDWRVGARLYRFEAEVFGEERHA